MGTRFCPRCKSTDIVPDLSIAALGAGTVFNSYECKNCGWNGIFFPETVDDEADSDEQMHVENEER